MIRLLIGAATAAALLASAGPSLGGAGAPASCHANDGGLTLTAGFCGTVFAENVSGARHIVVAPNGDVLVNTRPRPAGAGAPPAAAGVMLLRDADGDGKAEVRQRLTTGRPGTGIGLHGGYLYSTSGDAIVRHAYTPGTTSPLGAPDTIVAGLPMQGHNANNFVINNGTLYVNVGSQTNSCQVADRQNASPGNDPCTELQSRAGIWTFDAGRRGQTPAQGRRFATGMRNSVALARNPVDGRIYAAVHGRDQLLQNWGSLFTAEQSAEKPAEEFVQVNEGDNFGWPYCYYDPQTRKRVTAPEYGGDGNRSDRCGSFKAPLFGYPGHWAPNGLAFYNGTQFPQSFRNGAFIAFHGSWNRAPLPQAGFNVVFQPMTADGRLAGNYMIFADGLLGTDARSQARVQAGRRPTGIAISPDGSLYVSDDLGGTIWKITFAGVSK